MTLRTALLALFGFGVSACGEPAVTPASTTATIEISDLYVIAPSGGRDITGGGMQITATGDDFRLVAVSSEAAEQVELHTMEIENDVMRMRQAESFDIKAGETLTLEPGGPHLMLFGFDTSLQPGDAAEMLFTFENSDEEEIVLNYAAEVETFGER